MTRIRCTGLGIMGSPMAANLAKPGHEVRGHDHHVENIDRLAAAGGIAARARGDGKLDHSALLRTVEALSGRDAPR